MIIIIIMMIVMNYVDYQFTLTSKCTLSSHIFASQKSLRL